MRSKSLKLLLSVAERRERVSATAVAVRRRAVDVAAQVRAEAQHRMDRASIKAENERIKQARQTENAVFSVRRLREGHEFGYFLLWQALGEFSEVRKADVALAEKRSELEQAAQLHRQLMRRRQKLEAMYDMLRRREGLSNAMLEGDN